MYVCDKCWNIYDLEKLNKQSHITESEHIVNGIPHMLNYEVDYYCPIHDCWGDIIEVDELMYPIIKLLNKKGYKTQNCCSGHVHGDLNCYIQFHHDSFIKIPSSTLSPAIIMEWDVCCIRQQEVNLDDKLTDLQKFDYIASWIRELLSWVERLKDLNED